jgi:predicted enzyme related to lactoylglutathione lyase
METHCKDVPEHWLSYIAVDNVDERYKKALAAGAKEGRAPFDIPKCRPHCHPPAAGRRHDRLDHPETDVTSN